MAKKWIKRIGIALSAFIALLLILVILVYIPPVQNFLQREVTAHISKSYGMDISIDYLRLRFPLNFVAKDAKVIQESDTILYLQNLGLKVRLLPLLKGNVEAHGIFLENAHVNTLGTIPGMQLKGHLGRFDMDTHVINLPKGVADLETIELSDVNLSLTLNDTVTAPRDTTETVVNWKILLPNLEVKNFSFVLNMPADTMEVTAYIGDGQITNIQADLNKQAYGIDNIAVKDARVDYNQGVLPPVKGLDVSHIALRNIELEADSVLYSEQEMAAVIRNLVLSERSGLSITHTSGRFYSDSVMLHVPEFTMQTPHSEIKFNTRTNWSTASPFDIERFNARLLARLGKQDVLLLAGEVPPAFEKDYPSYPLVMQMGIEGTPDDIRISTLSADLPGAFSLKGTGQAKYPADSIKRSVVVDMQMQTQNLNFLLSLADMPQDSTVVIPPVHMNAGLKMNGPQLTADLLAREGEGRATLYADYNLGSEAYKADLKIDSLLMKHFMPRDSLYYLSVEANVAGKGTDFTSPQTTASVTAGVNLLEYGRYKVTGINLVSELKNALLTARINSNNSLLVMDAEGEYRTNTPYLDARASVNIADMDAYRLGIIDTPMKEPFSLSLTADAKKDSIKLFAVSGDLEARFYAGGGLQEFIDRSVAVSEVLMKQIEEKHLNHVELRESLPTVRLTLKAGQDNPVSRYMADQNIRISNASAGFVVNPNRGINGRAVVHGLRVDSLQLDTLYLVAFQDTARLNLRGGVTNGPGNPHTFKATLTGEVRSEDAELMLEYKDGRGDTGVKLGANIRPYSDGVGIRFIPENPVVAFHEFSFNKDNQVFVRHNGRVLANVEMLDKEGMGLRVHSMPDTTYLQNLDIEVRRIDLGNISKVLPYYPDFSGLFSAEAIFQQTEDNMQLSVESVINDLMYEEGRVGNLNIGATWLPGSEDKHYVNAYLGLEGQEVFTIDGSYQAGSKDVIDMNAVLKHFPLHVAGAFVPDGLIEFYGDLDGEIAVTGAVSKPEINGELLLDSVSVYSSQYGVAFNFQDRSLPVTDSKLVFDKYEIYTTSKNPFTIDGFVDFRDLSNANADLSLRARNYELVNAPKRENSLLYGKMYVDLNSTVKGPLTDLVMRGNLNVLGSTDINYVLIDSPLTVQDRLGDLVQFTSFADTVSVVKNEQTVALGGLDLVMTINIDETVEVGVDLAPDHSSYIDLEGGGSLTFQYTPQGDMILTGRYTLTGGNMKYSLPVIPLKEFKINEGSYVEWTGDPMDPRLNFKATERLRASVKNRDSNGSRMVAFNVSIEVKNTLNDLVLLFDLTAPDDPEVQKELEAMDLEERNKQAVALMATGVYLAGGGGVGDELNMGSALNNILQSQISSIAGSALQTVNITFDMENYDDVSGDKRTDYSFKYAQRFFNDRVQVVVGGTISSGNNTEQENSFIDNISLEYRLDKSGTRNVRLYYDKNYESIFEGEVIETGVGLVLRKKVNRLGDLFIFRRKKD